MAARQPMSLFASLAAAILAHAFTFPVSSAAPNPCEPLPPPGGVLPGADGSVSTSIVWDPDGPGPIPAKIVVGGTFQIVGGARAASIAAFDGSSWSRLGEGFTTDVYRPTVGALATLPNGDLVAGGTFTQTGTTPVNNIARWDGAAWHSLGIGVNDSVRSLAVLPNGDLIAAGYFDRAGGLPANGLARWNGSQWTPLAGGPGPYVSALAVLLNGDLLAAVVQSQGLKVVGAIMRWDGVSWTPFGTGGSITDIERFSTLRVLTNGDVIATGRFTTIGGVSARSIARWTGAAWNPIGPGLQGSVVSVSELPQGRLIACGSLPTSPFRNSVVQWDGSLWVSIGSSDFAASTSLALTDGGLLIGGDFTEIEGIIALRLARWNGAAWSALASGFDNAVVAMTLRPDGDLFVTGPFRTAGGARSPYLARLSGGVWSSIGTLSGSEQSWGRALATMPNGDIVVAGAFTSVGGVPVSGLARWNGTVWSSFGTIRQSIPTATLAPFPNGDIAVGGAYLGDSFASGISRWNGERWSWLWHGSGPMRGPVPVALLSLPNGDLIAGGMFTSIDGVPVNNIARWDGATWWPLGPGSRTGVTALAVDASGGLLAAGSFGPVYYGLSASVGRWDGSSWQPVGDWVNGSINSLAVLRSGEIVAGGTFNTIVGINSGERIPANSLAYWNGAIWSPVGPGVRGSSYYTSSLAGTIVSISAHPDGGFYASGNFLFAGDRVSPYLARWPRPLAPPVVSHPSNATTTNCRGAATFQALGQGAVTYLWQKEYLGAFWLRVDALTNNASGISTNTLNLTNARRADAGRYRCVITDECGVRTTTHPATLSVCIADFNCSGRTDAADLLAFLSAWLAHDPRADINGSGPVNAQDLFDFLTAWFAHC